MSDEQTGGDLLAAILKQPRPHRVHDFPRKKPGTNEAIGQIALVVLTQNETLGATSEAERITRDEMKRGGGTVPGKNEASTGYAMIFQEALWCQILYRAVKVTDDPTLEKGLFRTAKDVGSLSPDEIAILANLYTLTRAECGPIVAEMDEDEMDGFMERLVEAANFGPLASFSPAILIGLAIFSAKRLYALRIANSSTGSPPSDGSNGDETQTQVEAPSEPG